MESIIEAKSQLLNNLNVTNINSQRYIPIKKDYTEYVTLDHHLWNHCILLFIYNFDIGLLGSVHLLANPLVDRCSSISLFIVRCGFDSIMLGVPLL